MGKYEVFTPEMEYPEGVTDLQAFRIYKAYELRRFAEEFEYRMENDTDSWVEDARRLIEGGEVTAADLVEAALDRYWDSESGFFEFFCEAVGDYVQEA